MSTQITFTTNRIVCTQTTIYNTPIPMKSEVTYLGLHLDQLLTWQVHIKAKSQQLNLSVKKYYLPTCQPVLTTFPQPRHVPTRGYNITQSSAPDDGHMVARNMLSNY
jgi:hypothetical protein